MKLKILFVTLWLIFGTLNTGAVYASFTHKFPRLSEHYTHRREDLAFAIVWGGIAAPITTFVTPFVTGFYVHGWSLDISKPPVCDHERN